MKYTGLVLIAFGLTNIIFPDFIAYIIWGASLFFGISMLLGSSIWPKKPKGENYVKVWDYKIFR